MAYDLAKPRVVATFYVYPTGGISEEAELRRRQDEITDRYSEAKLVSTEMIGVSSRKNPAMIAKYAIPEMFDQKGRPMESLLLIGRHGDDYIEYRISYAVADGEGAVEAAKQFLAEFRWP